MRIFYANMSTFEGRRGVVGRAYMSLTRNNHDHGILLDILRLEVGVEVKTDIDYPHGHQGEVCKLPAILHDAEG